MEGWLFDVWQVGKRGAETFNEVCTGSGGSFLKPVFVA